MTTNLRAPALDELEAMDDITLARIKVEVHNAMTEIDMQLELYSDELRAGARFPDAEWERRAKFARRKHKACLTNIKNITSARHQLQVADHAVEKEASRARHQAMLGAKGLRQQIIDSAETLLAVHAIAATQDELDDAIADLRAAFEAYEAAKTVGAPS